MLDVRQAVERDVKSMTASIASVRQISETLMDAAGSGEFQGSTEFGEKLAAEMSELTAAFDDVVERSRVRSKTLSSTEKRVEMLLGSIGRAEATIDELTTRLSQLDDAAAADPNCASRLHTELKVNCLNSVSITVYVSG